MNHYTLNWIHQHRPEVLWNALRVIRLHWLYRDQYGYGIGRPTCQLKNHCKSDRTFDLLVNQLEEVRRMCWR